MSQASYYFCSHCVGWSLLAHGVCQTCYRHFDLGQPDPSTSELETAVGPIEATLGLIVLERSGLPKICRLYATSGGLLFSPDLRRIGGKFYQSTDRIMPCWLSSLKRWQFSEPVTSNPRAVERASPLSERVIELLYETPGAMFVAFQRIAQIHWTSRACTIHLTNNVKLSLKPQHRRDGVFTRLKSHLDQRLTTGAGRPHS